jgi:periplasmic protein CpxP/Spy
MSQCVVRTVRLVAAAGAVSVWLIAPSSPSAAAGISQSATPSGSAGRVLPAQARPNAPPAQSIEANISDLHQRLQITPAQEAQFNALANVMRENARAEASALKQPPPNASAVDGLRAEIQYDEVVLAGLKRVLPALEALYAAMSPAQRTTADTVFRESPGG